MLLVTFFTYEYLFVPKLLCRISSVEINFGNINYFCAVNAMGWVRLKEVKILAEFLFGHAHFVEECVIRAIFIMTSCKVMGAEAVLWKRILHAVLPRQFWTEPMEKEQKCVCHDDNVIRINNWIQWHHSISHAFKARSKPRNISQNSLTFISWHTKLTLWCQIVHMGRIKTSWVIFAKPPPG